MKLELEPELELGQEHERQQVVAATGSPDGTNKEIHSTCFAGPPSHAPSPRKPPAQSRRRRPARDLRDCLCGDILVCTRIVTFMVTNQQQQQGQQ